MLFVRILKSLINLSKRKVLLNVLVERWFINKNTWAIHFTSDKLCYTALVKIQKHNYLIVGWKLTDYKVYWERCIMNPSHNSRNVFENKNHHETADIANSQKNGQCVHMLNICHDFSLSSPDSLTQPNKPSLHILESILYSIVKVCGWSPKNSTTLSTLTNPVQRL